MKGLADWAPQAGLSKKPRARFPSAQCPPLGPNFHRCSAPHCDTWRQIFRSTQHPTCTQQLSSLGNLAIKGGMRKDGEARSILPYLGKEFELTSPAPQLLLLSLEWNVGTAESTGSG